MIYAIDIDGVISTNPDFFRWFTYQLKKNGEIIYILSARNPNRIGGTYNELNKWGIRYDCLLMMDPCMDRDYKTQAEWKIEKIKKHNVDIWFDNDFKVYEKVCGVSFKNCKAKRYLI